MPIMRKGFTKQEADGGDWQWRERARSVEGMILGGPFDTND